MSASTSTTPADAFGQQPIDRVTAAAVAYLLLPNLIFLAGWFRWYVAIPTMSLLIWATMRCCAWRGAIHTPSLQPRRVITAVIATGFVWAAFGGAGHFVYANTDWLTRDAVLGDLVKSSWPLGYELTDGRIVLLRTAMAYYLPAAVFGKIFGLGAADFALYVWTGLGTALFLLLLPWRAETGRSLLPQIAVIVLFSGMDFIGLQVSGGAPSPFAYPHHIEWWSGQYQFSSHTTQLFWVPNHALPAWIATAVLVRHRASDAQLSVLVFVLPLLILWSPFAAIGILPFVLYEVALRLWRRQPLAIPAAAILGILPFAYLAVRLMTLQFDALPVGQGLPNAVFNTDLEGTIYRLLLLPLFLLLEALLLALALSKVLLRSRDLLATSCAVLTLLPFIRFGPGNDIVMRASIPALAVLAILTLVATTHGDPRRRSTSILIWAILAIGAITPLYEFWRAIALRPWPADYSQTLLQRNPGSPPNYVGNFNGQDMDWMLRPVSPIPAHR